MAENIYHITDRQTWQADNDVQFYNGDTLSSIGFIHCCRSDQIDFVLENWFRGQADLVLLQVNTKKLTSQLVFENLEGGSELFPHIYGPIDRTAITNISHIDKEHE